jgi:hypothetical protein
MAASVPISSVWKFILARQSTRRHIENRHGEPTVHQRYILTHQFLRSNKAASGISANIAKHPLFGVNRGVRNSSIS